MGRNLIQFTFEPGFIKYVLSESTRKPKQNLPSKSEFCNAVVLSTNACIRGKVCIKNEDISGTNIQKALR